MMTTVARNAGLPKQRRARVAIPWRVLPAAAYGVRIEHAAAG